MGESWRRFRWFEASLALSGVTAFAVVGPLRGVFATWPAVTLIGASTLFMIPGVLFARWFLGTHFSGVALLPAGFVLSAGAFALLGVPLLLLQSSLEVYLWASGTAVAASLLAAAVAVLLAALGRLRTAERESVEDREGALWVPFVALVAVLAWISRTNAPSFQGDVWIYLAWIREFLSGGALAAEEPFFGGEVGLSRVRINGWLLEQAALSRVSGVDPVELAFSYLNPALVVMALLAFYALARVLFNSERAALFCGCLYALFFLVHLDASRLSFGGEFVQRLGEDKLAAKFLFLPMTLAFAAVFLESGRRAYFWCFALLCFAVMAVHPIGLAILGLSMAGFGILHLAACPRSGAAWARNSLMGLAGLTAVAVPAISVYTFTGEPLTTVLTDSDINSNDPDVLRNMIFVSPERDRIFEFADGSYIMHPSLILDPVIAVAFVLGVPFLLWRVKDSLAARLLLGTLLLTTLVVYAAPIATFLGDNVVLPGQIWRLAWPIPLAALLGLGWLSWEATLRAGSWFGGPLARVLPFLVLAVLTAAAVSPAASGVEFVQRFNEQSRSAGFWPIDPIYPWFHDEAISPVVVLAPELQSARLPAYSSEANVVSRRGNLVLSVLPALEERAPGRIEVPQGSLDVRKFFDGTDLRTAVGILRRNDVDYVMVRSGSPLDGVLDELPGFEPVREPSERYSLYQVELLELDRQVDAAGAAGLRLPPQ